MGPNKTRFKVETDDMFSVQKCIDNPRTLWVYGENIAQSKSKTSGAGQAVIRGQENAFGLCTVQSIGNYMNDDNVDHSNRILNDIVDIEGLMNSGKYNTLTFPRFGLGTGRAKMISEAPETFFYMCLQLYHTFGYNNIKHLTIPKY